MKTEVEVMPDDNRGNAVIKVFRGGKFDLGSVVEHKARELPRRALYHAINRIAELEREACRFYHADGSFETLESPDAVKKKRIEAAQKLDRVNVCSAAIAAIEYAADPMTTEPEVFLRCWLHGAFDSIRKEWPDAPASVFKGVEITGGEA